MVIEDTSTQEIFFLSDELEKFIQEHFIELCKGKTFQIHMEAKPKRLYMSHDLKVKIMDWEDK